MQSADDVPEGRRTVGRLHDAFRASSIWSYAVLVGAAALSGGALHMAKSTTAAEFPRLLAQPRTLPTQRLDSEIDTSLTPLGK